MPSRHVPLVVDNTFLGPVFQSPLEHGADAAIYSATKFLGGHSDLVAGAITARDPELITRFKTMRAFFGTICEPFTAWMLQRSMATLWLRMTKQSKNATKLVPLLAEAPGGRFACTTRRSSKESRRASSRSSAAPRAR